MSRRRLFGLAPILHADWACSVRIGLRPAAAEGVCRPVNRWNDTIVVACVRRNSTAYESWRLSEDTKSAPSTWTFFWARTLVYIPLFAFFC
jgi:hypothetical protein